MHNILSSAALVAFLMILVPRTSAAQTVERQGLEAKHTATEESGSVDSRAAPPVPAPPGPYVIRNVDFAVTGNTLSFVLRQKLDLTIIGTSFPDKPSLETYIASQRQLLLNQRVLASVEAAYTMTPAEGGGYDVALLFTTKDTWNIVALPYIKYDSNAGLTLSLRGRDYNFLGSMQPLALNVEYRRDTDSVNSFGNSTSFTFPFQALGVNWSLGLSEDLQLWIGGPTPQSITSASLGLTLPGSGATTLTVTAAQGLSINANAPDPEPDPWYLSTSLSFGASIPMSIDLGYLGPISYGPSITISENWVPGQIIQYSNRGGTVISLGNSISFGRVDWIGNFKQGLSFSISNSNSNTLQNTYATGDLNLSMALYGTWAKLFGVTTQLQVINRYLGDELIDLGANLRGILDARIFGMRGIFLNLSVPVKLLDFPTHMVIGTDWLDFELQAQPFLDAAFVNRASGGLNLDDLWCSGGLEFLIYPKRLRSFIVRASLGFDLKAVVNNHSLTAKTWDGYNPYEIYFGTGLMY